MTQRGTGLDTWSRFFYLVHGPVSALVGGVQGREAALVYLTQISSFFKAQSSIVAVSPSPPCCQLPAVPQPHLVALLQLECLSGLQAAQALASHPLVQVSLATLALCLLLPRGTSRPSQRRSGGWPTIGWTILPNYNTGNR